MLSVFSRRFLACEQNDGIHGMSDNTCCYVIAVNLLHRWHCFLLTRWRRLLRLSNGANWACLLPKCAMFMSSAVLVTLRFRRPAVCAAERRKRTLARGLPITGAPAAAQRATRPANYVRVGVAIFSISQYSKSSCLRDMSNSRILLIIQEVVD